MIVAYNMEGEMMNIEKIRHATILLVDDEPTSLGVLLNYLAKFGLTVRLVQSGESALALMKKNRPDIMLLDILMPGMDGFETCRRLKKNADTRDIPVIFMSSLTDTVDKMQGFEVGGVDYLTKPLQHEEVLARIHTHVTIRDLQHQLQAQNARLDRQNAQLTELNASLAAERALLAERVQARTAELSTANAELVRAARLKDEFLATMSHELRTPLHIILSMAETLRELGYDRLNAKHDAFLQRIEESGHHLLALITGILEFSQMIAGEVALDITTVPVELVCRAGLRSIDQLARKKGLKVASRFDSSVTTIHADERYLHTVLENLLNNAVKFTPDGGEIGLDVEGDAEKGVMHVTVWDRGIGIAKDDMERLFQPFVQLDGSLSRDYEGVGLGLAVVHHIVELHSGTISVESDVGNGSRFTVSLPWERPKNP